MPREQINYPDLTVEPRRAIDGKDTPPVHGEAWRDPALHISWLAQHDENMEPVAGHVQVAFEADPAYFEMAAGNPNEPPDRSTVYSPVLSRSEINRMIRALKRARDQVHGRDE